MKLLLAFTFSQAIIGALAPAPGPPSADDILVRLENETARRYSELKAYSVSRQYTVQNLRFGKQAAVGVFASYRELEGERQTVLTRSGSDRLNGVIDQVLAGERRASVPLERARHQISSANYRVRLLGSEVASGRNCYVLGLSPKTNSQFLIVGRAWVDAERYAVVRIDGQFAASVTFVAGAPRIREDFVEVNGFWLPGHVQSVTSSLLLGSTELEIVFSNYQFAPDQQ